MIVGIIGTGTIGTILIESFIESEALKAEHLIIHNRTAQKARKLTNKFQKLKISPDVTSLAAKSDLIIICTKPKDIFAVIQEIKPHITEDKCVITVTSPVSVSQTEKHLSCSVARVIPSITNRALAGATLFTYGEKCNDSWKQRLHCLFSHISNPIEISNSQTRIASDIASCGPAFMSFITRTIIDDAVKFGSIDPELASKLTEEMMIGFAALIQKKHYTLKTLQEKVMVPGGITGEGITALENEIPGVFYKVYEATHNKFNTELPLIEKQFALKYTSYKSD